MKPVDQDKFGKPDGNCFSACVASILELPLSEVPAFGHKNKNWWDDFRRWCHKRELEPLIVTFPEEAELPECYYIGSGQGKRGLLHSTVWYGDRLIHDPHPSRSGLLKNRPTDFVFLLKRADSPITHKE